MRRRDKAKWVLAASVAVLLASPGWGQFFYNEKLDSQAKAAMAEYVGMRDAHLAMLEDRQTGLAGLSDRVDKAVVAAIQAERDREIIRVLEKPLVSGDNPDRRRREELVALVEQRVRQLSGFQPETLMTSQGRARSLMRMAGISTSGLAEEAYSPNVAPFDEGEAARRMGEFHADFVALGVPKDKPTGQGEGPGKGTNAPSAPRSADNAAVFSTYAKLCESDIVPDLLGKTSAEQDAAYREFFQALPAHPLLGKISEDRRYAVALRLAERVCPPVKQTKRQKDFVALAQGDGQLLALKALAGIGLSKAEAVNAGPGPAIDLGLEIQDLSGSLEVASAEVKKGQQELRNLRNEQKDLEKAMKDGSVPRVQQAVSRVVAIVGKPPEPAAAPPATLTGTPSLDVEAAAGALEGGLKAVCSGTVTLACARQVAEAYGLASFDKARESALFEIATLLADPKLRADAAKKSCGEPAQAPSPEQMAKATRICLTRSAVDLLGVADRAGHINAGRPGELAGLAVRIADAQMRVGTAEAKASALTRRIDNLAAQRAALVNELNILMQAHAKLTSKGDYRVALLEFGRSIDKGRLPYERMSDQFALIALNEFAAREEQVVKGRYAIIDGLLATITSSTAAGLKPAELAAFLSAIGVTTIGIAEATE